MSPRHFPRGAHATAVAAFIVVCAPAAGAQMLATRNVMIAPAIDSAGGAISGFPQPRFWIEAARGWGSKGGEQAWNIKLGGSFQIEIDGGRTVLLGVFAHELTSNPYNDLGYNPRGAIWDENAFVVRRHPLGDAYLGVMFRCRHELDNADGSDERLPDSLRVATARILGLGGGQLGFTTKEFSRRGTTVRGYVRVEGYFHTKDERAPDLRDAPDWRDAIGTFAAGARVSRPLRPGLTLYSRGWMSVMAFRPEDGMTSRANARVELGLRGWGTPGGMDFHVAYERFFDDLSRPVPQPNKALFAGIRVTPSEMF